MEFKNKWNLSDAGATQFTLARKLYGSLQEEDMTNTFASLIADFCAAAKLPDPKAVVGGSPFQNDGVTFAFRHDPGAPDTMTVYTDFGSMPAEHKDEIYRVLLEENFIESMALGSSFGLQGRTGNIVYAEQLALETLTPEQLFQRFALRTKQAREWRISHFVDDLPVSTPRARGAGWLNQFFPA
jgi:hypothetical protein